jgi:hypothetical protein
MFAWNLASPWSSIFFVRPQPKRETMLTCEVCSVLLLPKLYVSGTHNTSTKHKSAHPSSAALSEMFSCTDSTFTCSRLRVWQETTRPTGSTSLSSRIQLSARWMMPCGAQRGSAPRLRMRRVVRSAPASVKVRATTSQETTCAAYGFG